MIPQRRRAPVLVLAVAAVAAALTIAIGPAGPIAAPAPVELVGSPADAPRPAGAAGYRFRGTKSGTDVFDRRGQRVARFTTGARTVLLTGPERSFGDADLRTTRVSTRAWVRVLDTPWKPGRKAERSAAQWLDESLDWRVADALAVAFQYVAHAKDRRDDAGARYAGDADFGEEIRGSRSRGGDFSDYLGTDWTFADGVKRPALSSRYGDVDCSGYLRLVWGYRMGVPMVWNPAPKRGALPRTADWIGKYGPGVKLFQGHVRPRMLERLQAGDLVFFDTDGDGKYNHSGIIVGWDDRGDLRFISSRRTANGPNMSDAGGASIVTGHGHYASTLVTARRL
jgi:hypothetical protein